MLVLTRGLGQSIRIGNDVVLTVTRLENGRICLGVDAPKSVFVRRAEALKRPERVNRIGQDSDRAGRRVQASRPASRERQ